MDVFAGLLGMVGLASVLYALYILTQFSRRLGAVTKMPPYFRGYYAAAALAGVAFVTRLLLTSILGETAGGAHPELAWINERSFVLLSYHVPLALAVTIALVVTWRYWSWLWRE